VCIDWQIKAHSLFGTTLDPDLLSSSVDVRLALVVEVSTFMAQHNLLLILCGNHHVSLLGSGCRSSGNLILTSSVLGRNRYIRGHHEILVVGRTTLLVLEVVSLVRSCSISELALWLVLE